MLGFGGHYYKSTGKNAVIFKASPLVAVLTRCDAMSDLLFGSPGLCHPLALTGLPCAQNKSGISAGGIGCAVLMPILLGARGGSAAAGLAPSVLCRSRKRQAPPLWRTTVTCHSPEARLPGCTGTNNSSCRSLMPKCRLRCRWAVGSHVTPHQRIGPADLFWLDWVWF